MTLTVKGPGLAGLLKNVRALTRTDVLVGIPADNADRKPDEDEPGPISNAALGYIHETGQPELNIPERPFLRPGIAMVEEQIVERFKRAGQQALIGDDAGVERQQHAAGLIAQNAVKARLVDGPHAPLSKVTLKRRKERGRKGEKPLIDTAQLLNAVTYVIRDRNV